MSRYIKIESEDLEISPLLKNSEDYKCPSEAINLILNNSTRIKSSVFINLVSSYNADLEIKSKDTNVFGYFLPRKFQECNILVMRVDFIKNYTNTETEYYVLENPFQVLINNIAF